MKKTLKLVLLFASGLTAIITIAIVGYFIISNNKTYYIYDVRFVHPVEQMAGYIYTTESENEEEKFVNIKNQTVYMYSKADNVLPIAVYASTSTKTKDVKITSSDPSIAKIVATENKCYVQYLKEGVVTITSEVGGVTDSFILKILDQVPSDFQVFDKVYYGEEYVGLFPNSLVSYADGTEYRYSYTLSDVTGSDDLSMIDGDLIRIDRANLDTNIFEDVLIDSFTHELVIKCKIPEETQTDNINTTIVLQSFTKAKDGKEVVQDNYLVNVYVVLEIPEFLQIEVSESPDFDEGAVFTNTQKINISSFTEEQILANPSLLEGYLSAEKAERYLLEREEFATYNVYFTEKVNKIYIRFRMVYTNGKIEYLVDEDNAELVMSDESYARLAPMDDYYILTLSTDYYVETAGEYNDYEINVILTDYVFNFNFKFEYLELNSENVEKLYDYDEETGIYTYTYWDDRTHYTNEIYDEFGNVVAFGE